MFYLVLLEKVPFCDLLQFLELCAFDELHFQIDAIPVAGLSIIITELK